MIKLLKIVLIFLTISFTTSCSRVLQTVELQINTQDKSTQQKFNVVEKTLTIEEANEQNKSKYNRIVSQTGRAENAKTIPELLALKSKFPKKGSPAVYKVGIGDTLTFSRLLENNQSSSVMSNQWPSEQGSTVKYELGIGDTLALTLIKNNYSEANLTTFSDSADQNVIIAPEPKDETINSTGRIGSDGSILLLEVGRLEAEGKTLNDLRSEVRNILIRNGISPRFQLEILEFKSQRAYLTVNNTSSVILLDDQRTTVRDVLTSANVGFTPGVITRVRIQRDGKEFFMSLRSIFNQKAPNVNVKPHDHIFVEDSSAEVLSADSTVDLEGNIIFKGVGTIKASGRSLNEIRNSIKELIQKLPDSQNAFQIEITKFSSQKALVSIPERTGGPIEITNTPAALDEILTQKGLSIDGSKITRIKLYRQGANYEFTLDDLLNPNNPRIYLENKDRVAVEFLPYKQSKVFILGGVSPQIFKINPSKRETLADVLFTSGGPLSASNAKRSEVYLLRGKEPVVAYHLDAQSTTRLIVADAMELRPNDIIYVAEQPIISFNRTLATIIPLRILLRDVQDGNVP